MQHPRLGVGTVLEVRGEGTHQEVRVRFDGGGGGEPTWLISAYSGLVTEP